MLFNFKLQQYKIIIKHKQLRSLEIGTLATEHCHAMKTKPWCPKTDTTYEQLSIQNPTHGSRFHVIGEEE